MTIKRDEETEHLREEIAGLWSHLEGICELFPDSDDWTVQDGERVARYGVNDWELAAKELQGLASDDGEDFEYTDAERYVYGKAIDNIARRITRYVPERNLSKLESAWVELSENASYFPEALVSWGGAPVEQIGEIVNKLTLLTPTLVYVDPAKDEPAKQIAIPKLIIGVNELLTEHLASNPELLRKLAPQSFERFMGEIFANFGYEIEVTRPSKDGGVDIIAISSNNGILSRTLIECKRFTPPNNVGVSYVRQLLGVRASEAATQGVIVTTSYFTRDARSLEEQNKYQISLQDFDAISRWVKDYAGQNRPMKSWATL